jgi:hypothetical protein
MIVASLLAVHLQLGMTLLAQQLSAEIAGTYVGRYICGRVIGMQLALESAGPGRVSGVFTFFNDGGTAANSIGRFVSPARSIHRRAHCGCSRATG